MGGTEPPRVPTPVQSAGILSGGSDVTDVIGFQQLIAAMFKASPDFAVILLGAFWFIQRVFFSGGIA